MGNFNSIKRHRLVYGTQQELNNSDKKIAQGLLIDEENQEIFKFTTKYDNYSNPYYEYTTMTERIITESPEYGEDLDSNAEDGTTVDVVSGLVNVIVTAGVNYDGLNDYKGFGSRMLNGAGSASWGTIEGEGSDLFDVISYCPQYGGAGGASRLIVSMKMGEVAAGGSIVFNRSTYDLRQSSWDDTLNAFVITASGLDTTFSSGNRTTITSKSFAEVCRYISSGGVWSRHFTSSERSLSTENLFLNYVKSTRHGVNNVEGEGNIIVGYDHVVDSDGSIVSGYENTVISCYQALVKGGENTVDNSDAAQIAGEANSIVDSQMAQAHGKDNNISNAPFATVSGRGLEAHGSNIAMVLGKYNVEGESSANDVFVIGNGENGEGGPERSNLFTIDKLGNVISYSLEASSIVHPKALLTLEKGNELYVQNEQPLMKQFDLTDPYGSGNQYFGRAVCSNQDKIAVGFPDSAGKVLVYDNTGTLLTTITTPTEDSETSFGESIAMTETHILIGTGASKEDDEGAASNTGNAYLFDVDGVFVTEVVCPDPAGNDQFGNAVALSDTHIVVGAPQKNSWDGAAYLYGIDGTFIAKLVSDEVNPNTFGNYVGIIGDSIFVTERFASEYASAAGALYAFGIDGVQTGKVGSPNSEDSGYFGTAMDTSSDRIIVSAVGEESQTSNVYIFDASLTLLSTVTRPAGFPTGTMFGSSVAISDTNIVCSTFNDETYILDNDFNILATLPYQNYDFTPRVDAVNGRIVIQTWDGLNGLNQISVFKTPVATASVVETITEEIKAYGEAYSIEEKAKLAGLEEYVSPHFDDAKGTLKQNATTNPTGDYSVASGYKAKAESFAEIAHGGSPTEVAPTEDSTFSGTVETQTSEFSATASTMNTVSNDTEPFIHTSSEDNRRYGYCEATVFGQEIGGSKFVDNVIFLVDFADYSVTLVSTDEKFSDFAVKPTYTFMDVFVGESDKGLITRFDGVDGSEIIYSVKMAFSIIARAKSLSEVFGLAVKAGSIGLGKLPDTINAGELSKVITVTNQSDGYGGFTFVSSTLELPSTEIVVFSINNIDASVDSDAMDIVFPANGVAQTWAVYNSTGVKMIAKENYTSDDSAPLVLDPTEDIYLVVVPTAANGTLGSTSGDLDCTPLYHPSSAEFKTTESGLVEGWDKFAIAIPKITTGKQNETSREVLTKDGVDVPLTRFEDGDSDAWVSFSAPLARGEYIAESFLSYVHQSNGEEASEVVTITIEPYFKSATLAMNPIPVSASTNGTIGGVPATVSLNTIDDEDTVGVEPVSTNKFDFSSADTNAVFDASGLKVDVGSVMTGAGTYEKWGTVRAAVVSVTTLGTNGDATDGIDPFDVNVNIAIDGDSLAMTQEKPVYRGQVNDSTVLFEVDADGVLTYSGYENWFAYNNGEAPGSITLVSSDPAIIEVRNTFYLEAHGLSGESATITATFTHPVSGVVATQSLVMTIEQFLYQVHAGQHVSAVANMQGVGVGVPFNVMLEDSDNVQEALDLSMVDVSGYNSNGHKNVVVGNELFFRNDLVTNNDFSDCLTAAESGSDNCETGMIGLAANGTATGLASQVAHYVYTFWHADADGLTFTQDKDLVIGNNNRSFSAIFSAHGQAYDAYPWFKDTNGLTLTVVSPAEVTLTDAENLVIPAGFVSGTDVVLEMSFTHPFTGVSVTAQHTMTYTEVQPT